MDRREMEELTIPEPLVNAVVNVIANRCAESHREELLYQLLKLSKEQNCSGIMDNIHRVINNTQTALED